MANNVPSFSSKSTALPRLALPTIGNIIFVVLLLILTFNARQGLLRDGDTGYHIRTGEIILQTWRVPTHDPYSFQSPPLEWTAHEWLSEVLMAAIFRWSGLTGIVLFFASLLALTHWLLYRSLRAPSDAIVLCVIVAVLASATSSSHWLARPHAFSLLLTVVWYYCLGRFQYRQDSRIVYYLPPLMLLWVNFHGGFIIALILTGIYLVGNVLFAIGANPSERQGYRRKARQLLIVLPVLLGACLINPFGNTLLQFPFRLTGDRFIMDRVLEFLPPNFHDALPFKYMLLALVGALALSRSSLNVIEAALVLLLTYMALYSARYMSLFAIIVAPILLKTAASGLTRLPDPALEFYRQRNRILTAIDCNLNGYLWPVAGIIFVSALALGGRVKFQFDNKRFPVAAVEFLKREPISGNMFNNDEFGDYLIFAAWPSYRVFMDGRSDMYGERFISSYYTIANALPGWRDELAQFDITWVIFDTESPLTAALQGQNDWQPIYSDRIATIFVKKTQAHAALLTKYAGVLVARR